MHPHPKEESEATSVNAVQTTDLEIYHAPNGLKFFHHSTSETNYVYAEIFEENVYLQNGITIEPSDVVFDIGANIGLFSIFLKENYQGVKVYAFEPSPPIFRILEANAACYADSLMAFPYGIAEKAGEALFTHYPNYSIMSGLHANDEEDRAVLLSGIKSQFSEKKIGTSEVGEVALQRLVRAALGQKIEYVCQLRTISGMIEELGIESIGLLKIDAEGSELGILGGISNADWPKVRQIAMEIHDVSGVASKQIHNLLDEKGYESVFREELRLVGSGIVNCYACRKHS